VSAGGTLVLLYHRVACLERDPHRLAVLPDRFAQHCEILRRRFDVVALREWKRPGRQVAITFDDGYADNALEARSILAAAGLPATFFITVGRVGEREEAWWDRLEQTLLGCHTAATTIEIEIAGRRLWADVRSPQARERAHFALFWRLRSLRLADIDSALSAVALQLGTRSENRPSHRWMNVEELRELSASDGIDIGAHTITHPFLSTLDAEEQWQEIHGSRQALERLLDTGPGLFAYPYGVPNSFHAVTTELVRKAGYTMACTATGGVARPDCDPLRIPRNPVGDWDAERFEHWLDCWLSEP
jgi:peptidoglycan/xylan/chitin deacetylase (PgdA/CDA1 family)